MWKHDSAPVFWDDLANDLEAFEREHALAPSMRNREMA